MTLSTSQVSIPTVGSDNSLAAGLRGRIYLGGEYEGNYIHYRENHRPVTSLKSPACPMTFVLSQNNNYISETSASFEISEPGVYDFEYGLSPYTLGSGGFQYSNLGLVEGHLNFMTGDLIPGKVYDMYTRKHCAEGEAMWIVSQFVTTISSNVEEYPYLEDFNPTESRGNYLITRGWKNLTPSNSSWTFYGNGLDNNSLGIKDFQCCENNQTVYSRPMMLHEGHTYQIAFDYSFMSLNFPGTQNTFELNLLINSSINADNATVLASVPEDITDGFDVFTFEYTPTASGVYYFGLQGVFPSNPTTDYIGYNGFNYILIDNFSVNDQTLSLLDNGLVSLNLYPNPVQNELTITSNEMINSVMIYDLRGALLHEINPMQKIIQISTDKLNSGMYMIHIATDNSNSVHKIIKK